MSIERRKVINRDGVVEDLNIEKIREKLLMDLKLIWLSLNQI